MQIQNPPIAFGIRPANGLDNIWSFWIGLLCGIVWMEGNGFTGQMGWDGMGLLANRIGLGWVGTGSFFPGSSSGGAAAATPSAAAGGGWWGLLSGTPQMEMGPGAWRAAP